MRIERGKAMKIPKYVIDIMGRSRFCLIGDPGYDPGYTIMVRKRTAYTTADTFVSELERLVKWAKKNGATFSRINKVPAKTRHEWQYATVTIYDPVMLRIEDYIKEGEWI